MRLVNPTRKNFRSRLDSRATSPGGLMRARPRPAPSPAARSGLSRLVTARSPRTPRPRPSQARSRERGRGRRAERVGPLPGEQSGHGPIRASSRERGRGRRAERVGLLLGQQALADGQAVVGLRHGAHELARDVQQHVGGQVQVRVAQVARDPAGQLVALVVPLVALVRKHLRARAAPSAARRACKERRGGADETRRVLVPQSPLSSPGSVFTAQANAYPIPWLQTTRAPELNSMARPPPNTRPHGRGARTIMP